MSENLENESWEKTAKNQENDDKFDEKYLKNDEILNNDAVYQSKISRFFYNLKGILSLKVSNIILFLEALFFGFMTYFFVIQIGHAASVQYAKLFRVFMVACIIIAVLALALLVTSLILLIKRIKNKNK